MNWENDTKIIMNICNQSWRKSAAREEYFCDLCKKTIGRLDNFKVHLKKKHSVQLGLSCTLPKNHQCPECKLQFYTKAEVNSHYERKHKTLALPQATPAKRKMVYTPLDVSKYDITMLGKSNIGNPIIKLVPRPISSIEAEKMESEQFFSNEPMPCSQAARSDDNLIPPNAGEKIPVDNLNPDNVGSFFNFFKN